MRITIKQALTGTGRQWAFEEYNRLAAAVTISRNIADDYLLGTLRAQMATALSPKVSKTWRRYRYPATGQSANAASNVVSNVPWIVDAFTTPATILPRKGKFLTIPTEHAPKRGTDGKRAMPHNWPEQRLGPLRLIVTRRGLALVVDDVKASFTKKTGQFRRFQLPGQRSRDKAAREGRSFQSVVMFWLRPVARMKKKLTPYEIHRNATLIFFRGIQLYLANRNG